MLTLVVGGISATVATGLFVSYKRQRAVERRKIVYLCKHHFHMHLFTGREQEALITLLRAIHTGYEFMEVKKYASTKRGHNVLCDVIKTLVPNPYRKLVVVIVRRFIPYTRDTPLGFIKSIFRPDI